MPALTHFKSRQLNFSFVMSQGYINNTTTELGFSHGEDINLTSKQVNSGDFQSRPISHQLNFRSTALVSPTAERNCSARTILDADINVRIRSEDNDSSRRKEADFATSVGNEPNRIALSQSNTGLNRAMKDGFVWNPAGCGYFVRPGMVINQTGAFDGWAEDYLVPATLPPATNTTSFLSHHAETSREDASARVIYSITGSDYKNQFRPYSQHHENSFLQSTDSEVDRKSRNLLHPDSVLEWEEAKGTAAEDRGFQPNGFHEATYQSEFQALARVRREAAQARDGLTILSFAAGYEAVVKSSQQHDTALDIRSVSQNRVSANIVNLKSVSSLVPGPSRGHSASVTVSPEARKCRTLHPVQTNHLSTSSITSSGDASGDLSRSSLSAVPPAQCNRSESFQASGPIASRLFDKALANPTTDSDSSRVEHLTVTSVSKETPSVHMEDDLSINLTLTSHMSTKPGDSGSPCTSSKSVSGSLAEPSAPIASRVVFAAEEDGNSGYAFAPRKSKCTGPLECSQLADGHGLDQQALRTKNFLKVSSSKQTAEIVIEKYSTQSSTNSSAWLGLAPPTSDNLHP